MRALICACLALPLLACVTGSTQSADLPAVAEIPTSPPFSLGVQLGNPPTLTALPDDPTATSLPEVPLRLGGQGLWMVVPRLVAKSAWPHVIFMKLWLTREPDDTPILVSTASAQVPVRLEAGVYQTEELPLPVGDPCEVAGRVLQVHLQVAGGAKHQTLVGRMRPTWVNACP